MRAKNFLYFLVVSVSACCFFQDRPCLAGEGSNADEQETRQEPWTITAKGSLSYEEKTGHYLAKGDVAFKRGDQAIYADEASYNTKTAIAEVKGNVRFESIEGVLTADEGVFDLKNQTGYLVNGQLFLEKNHYYISGDQIEKVSSNTYVIKDCRLTTCDGPAPDWSITGADVRVIIEGMGRVKNATFRVKDIPVFYLPYLRFPVKTKRQTGFLSPRMGYSERNGLDIELPFFWAISDQFDATFYERYMVERGLMQGFEFRYAAENDSRGLLLFDILSDSIEEKDLTNPQELELSPTARSNRTRYWLRGRADQQISSDLGARLDLDFISDQDYLREFQGELFGFEARPDLVKEWNRPLEEIHSPLRRSALRLSHEKDDYAFQGLLSYYQRPEGIADNPTPQPLTGLDFSILPRPLNHFPLAFSFDSDYDYIWRDFGQKGHRLQLNPKMSLPLWLGPYLSFEPSLGLNHYTAWLDEEANGEDQLQTRDALRFKTRLSTLMERIYDSNWKSARRMKHKIVPSLYYEYQHYDQDGLLPWFEPIEEEGKINRLAFSLENFFDARRENADKGRRYYQWAHLSFTQGYDLDEALRDEEPLRAKEPFEPLIGELGLSLYDDLDLKAEAHWNHYEEDLDFVDLSFNFRLNRSGERQDHLEIDYIFLRNESKTIQYSLMVNLWPRFTFGTSLKRDISGGQNISTNYWLGYESKCWAVRLSAGSLDDISGIMLTFRLTGIGSTM